MKEVSAYQTTDGLLFSKQKEAERHEAFLANRAVIEEFLESEINPYKSSAHRAIARNTVINWSLWSTKNAK
jgi:hypothetical protein